MKGPIDPARRFDLAAMRALLAEVMRAGCCLHPVLHPGTFRNRVWLPAVRAAGGAGAGFHDLRRLAATALVLEGVDVKTAQTRLGHSDPRLTLAVYASTPLSADRAAAERLGERFFPTGPTRPAVRGRPTSGPMA